MIHELSTASLLDDRQVAVNYMGYPDGVSEGYDVRVVCQLGGPNIIINIGHLGLQPSDMLG